MASIIGAPAGAGGADISNPYLQFLATAGGLFLQDRAAERSARLDTITQQAILSQAQAGARNAAPGVGASQAGAQPTGAPASPNVAGVPQWVMVSGALLAALVAWRLVA